MKETEALARQAINAPIAQRIERLTPIQKAVGSIPTRRTKGENYANRKYLILFKHLK